MTNNRKGPNITPSARLLIAQRLLENSKNGVLNNGITAEVAASFGVSVRTVRLIWQAARKQISEGQPIYFPERSRHTSSQLKQFDEEAIKAIPFSKRGTIRRLATELQVSKSEVGRWVKSGKLKAHTNAIKPALTDSNKVSRIKFSLCFLHKHMSNKISFESMHNVVHIDEKWFYMQRTRERAYKLSTEDDPYRACKSKRFISKVMFMAAVARPQYTEQRELLFDGKIGISPFTQQLPAIRKSAHRPRGAMVTKPIDSINKEVIKSCLLEKILPAIKAKWPANVSKKIIIQQDNARPHISNMDPDFRMAAMQDGFDIKLMCQPPNSPDTNVLDLGYFRAIQSLQIETRSYNVDDLVANVLQSFEELEHPKLNNIFLTLQACMVDILKVNGGNNYKLPHIGKAAQERNGSLPLTLEVDEQVVRQAIDFLLANEAATESYDIGGILTELGYM